MTRYRLIACLSMLGLLSTNPVKATDSDFHVIDLAAKNQNDKNLRCVARLPLNMWDWLYRDDFKRKRRAPSFGWTCVPSTEEGLKSAPFLGRLDEATQTWRIDFSEYTPEQYRRENPVTKLIQIRARNSMGAAITYDDMIGDPDRRSRHLSFCLLKPPVALCGSSEEVKRLIDPKSDLLPYALEVVRSIEFVEAAAVEQPSK